MSPFKSKIVVVLFILTALEQTGFAQSDKNSFYLKEKKRGKRMLVVSGGGARGAWGAGIVEGLVEKHGGYKAVMGTSTGSVIAPLVLLQDFKLLQDIYTNITQDSIFSENPFKQFKESEMPEAVKLDKFASVNKRKIITRISKSTIGETERMKEYIKRKYTKEIHDQIAAQGLFMGVSVLNVTTGDVELKKHYKGSSMKTEDMRGWIWASANEPLFMSYYYANGNVYLDGGVRQVIPLTEAIKYAKDDANEIDTIDVVINHSVKGLESTFDGANFVETPIQLDNTQWLPRANKGDLVENGWIGGLGRLLAVYDASTLASNLNIGKLQAMLKNMSGGRKIVVNFYWMSDSLQAEYQNELIFYKPKMKMLYDAGKNAINQHLGKENERNMYNTNLKGKLNNSGTLFSRSFNLNDL